MKRTWLVLAGAALLLTACERASPCLTPSEEAGREQIEVLSTDPLQVRIGGRAVEVDRLVEGPLCDDTWAGTVYVGCGVEVRAWQDRPTFLQGCDLEIDPGSVVYVADHNDSPYYNGCSCHTGELDQP